VTAGPAGYSGKPLVAKLGLEAEQRVALIDAPPGFAAALEPVPAGVEFVRRADDVDVALLFVRAESAPAASFAPTAAALRGGGMLWVAWPKQASRQPTDLTEDVVRRVGLAAGLVDVKVCAVDQVWSGLKFVRRRAAPGRAR
jgi:hypothetical protein